MSGRAFLSVVAWPDGASREDIAKLLANATGMEPATARMRLGNAPPLIVGMFDEPIAQRAAAVVENAGGIAFIAALEAIEAFGPTIKIRDMMLNQGRLYLDLWRREPTNTDPTSITLIVRGRHSEKKVQSKATASPMLTIPTRRYGYFGVGGSYGLAASLYHSLDSTELSFPSANRNFRVSYMIDLHTSDGRVFQIDADKFGFQVLGDQRGRGDMINTDRLCEMLVNLAPGVTVDPYFSLWRPPVELGRVRIPEVNRNNEDPAFALYSRWSALLYRHMGQRLG